MLTVQPLDPPWAMPEGDALSVYAMLQLNFAWHLYMHHYAPEVRSLSFVDNLMLTSDSPGALARGWTCLEAFFDMWNLSVDVSKSLCWATTTSMRKQMTLFPFQCVAQAAELGGVLSFTKRRFTGLQRGRLEALMPRWLQLRRSFAPLRQKLASLPIVFWASGLHGIAGSCLGAGHVDALRAQAVKSLLSTPQVQTALFGSPCLPPRRQILGFGNCSMWSPPSGGFCSKNLVS